MMPIWRGVAAAAAAIGLIAAAPQERRAAAAPRVILLSIDAGTDWMFDELLARGVLPAFARMRAEGAHADGMITVTPSLTAVAHASLWTGAWPRVHGVTGNNAPLLPRAAHRITEAQSGYESTALAAEPIWMAAARQGRRVFVAQATGAAPFPPRPPDGLLMFDTYSKSLLPLELIDGTVTRETPYRTTVGDTDLVVSVGAEGRLDVTLAGFHGALAPGLGGRFSPPIPLTVNGRRGYTRLRLIAYSPDRHTFTLLRGRIDELQSTDPRRLEEIRRVAGTLVGEAISRAYERGRFGATRADGGDGTAEGLLSDVIEANHEYFTGMVNVAARARWDLLVLYVSTLDISGHALVGAIDRENPFYRAEVASLVWPVVDRIVARTIDPLVAALRARFPDATLVITADHGMEGAHRYVYSNVALRQAGLLALDRDGRIDLSKTSALQPASMAGSIFVNSTDWKDGVVPPAEVAQVKRSVAAALLAIRDPATGAAPIRAVFDATIDGDALGIGGPAGPDLFVDTAPGYITSASRLTGDAAVGAMDASGAGEHGNVPWRRNLHAIFFAAGPQVAARGNPGLVRTIDVAPTVARLLRIAPPKQSAGRPIPLGPTTR